MPFQTKTLKEKEGNEIIFQKAGDLNPKLEILWHDMKKKELFFFINFEDPFNKTKINKLRFGLLKYCAGYQEAEINPNPSEVELKYIVPTMKVKNVLECKVFSCKDAKNGYYVYIFTKEKLSGCEPKILVY